MAVKRWIWIVIILFGSRFLLAAGGIGACVYFFKQHVDMREVSAGQAEDEFARVRARFKGEQPLLEVKSDGKLLITRLEQRAGTYSGPLPTTLHILAWEKGEPNRVRMSLPMWMLRMKGDFSIKSDSIDIERAHIRVEDIERAGPALLIDHLDGRSRLLVWTD